MDRSAHRNLSSTLMTNSRSPARLGFSMPAEWERHEATWLGWPHNPTDWPDKLDTIRWVYTEIVRKISAGELVRILVNSRTEAKLAARYLTRSGVDIKRGEFIVHPTNRGWTRDSGPLFVCGTDDRLLSSVGAATPRAGQTTKNDRLSHRSH